LQRNAEACQYQAATYFTKTKNKKQKKHAFHFMLDLQAMLTPQIFAGKKKMLQ
jgi:hypothetical protein